jgi:PAS domain S-box-containing protein
LSDAAFSQGDLVATLVRLAAGDFSVRLPRSHRRDEADTVAYMVNLVAEEVDRLVRERERANQELRASIALLSEQFVKLAAGDFTVRALRSGSGDPLDVLAYLFNNTADEVGDAFRELDRQKTMLEAILESMIDGLLLLDQDGRVRRGNGAIAFLLGMPASELVGLPVGELLAPAEQPLAHALLGVRDQGPIRGREAYFQRCDGAELALTLSAAPCIGSDGALVGIVVVARDDRQLKRARTEKMTERLAAMGMVAAGVAHEMNNPLAYVLANLSFALEDLEAELARQPALAATLGEVVTSLRLAQSGSERLRDIVRAFKTFSGADREIEELVDVDAVVEAAATMVRNEVAHHARLVVESGGPPRVFGNEAKLGQVFANLLQNAAQSIREGAAAANTVRIATGRTSEGFVFIDVEDTGAGIPPENLPHIYDAFFTTKPVGSGTGIGLFICRQIVTSMGGAMSVKSELRKGTLFRVTLPAAPAHAANASPAQPAKRPVARPKTGPDTGPQPRHRVLVVDDTADVAHAVQRMLARDHDVDVAIGGCGALDLIARNRYDAVVCDLMMPDLTGMDLHAAVAERQPDLLPRMIFMTGGTFISGSAEFLDRIPNARLLKPFGAAELRDAVSKLLRG